MARNSLFLYNKDSYMKILGKAAIGTVVVALTAGALWFLLRNTGPRETIKGSSGTRIDIEELSFYIKGDKVFGKVYRPVSDSLTRLPAVVVCHDIGRSADDCDALCRRIADRGFIGYCFDFKGGSDYSRSTGDPLAMSARTEAEDIKGVLKALRKVPYIKDSRVYLAGEGLGALSAAMAAASDKALARALILISPSVNIPDLSREMYPRMKDIPDTSEFQGMMVGKLFFKEIHDYKPFKKIGGYTGRTLVVHGTNDPFVDTETVRATVDAYDDARLEVIKGGHSLMKSSPGPLADAIAGFLD